MPAAMEFAPHLIGAAALAASLGWLGAAAWFVARFRAPALPEDGRVTLLLCTTGDSPHLPPLLDALARQTLPPRRLVVAVESEDDPAFAQVRALAAALPFPVELVVAGTSPGRSQKATSLIAAASRVDDQDQAVVLLDTDILPPPGWLSWLASPAIRGSQDIVSGYRWQVAGGGGPARQFVAWLDRGFAIGPRQIFARQVWGGSTAINGAAFARLDLPAILDRTLSTDGAISRRAAALGLRMLMRRAVLLPTPPEGGERGALAFQRRQMQLYRIYAPRNWAMLGLVFGMEALALLLVEPALAGQAVAAGWLAALAAAGLARAALQDAVTRRLGVAEPAAARAAQLGFGLLSPVTAALALLLWASSARTRRVLWRHVEYEVLGPESVRVVARRAPQAKP
jgi:hypothetical protein